jgi:hypothetical protein
LDIAMDLLKLVALDRDDLEVISAHLQDSTVKVGEILWRPAESRMVVGLDRFDWEAANGSKPVWQRRRAALRFDRVLSCKCRNVMAQEKDKILTLLAVEFTENDPPAGMVTLLFLGGTALRLEVECLEVEVADLGRVWTTDTCPDHPEGLVIEGEARRA